MNPADHATERLMELIARTGRVLPTVMVRHAGFTAPHPRCPTPLVHRRKDVLMAVTVDLPTRIDPIVADLLSERIFSKGELYAERMGDPDPDVLRYGVYSAHGYGPLPEFSWQPDTHKVIKLRLSELTPKQIETIREAAL